MKNSEEQIDHLADFPKVRDWIHSRQHHPPTMNEPIELHLAVLANALRKPDATRCRYWSFEIARLAETISSFFEHILECDQLANTLNTSLTDMYGKLAELALATNEGPTALATLQILAGRTELAAFRFLAAFTAFNMNDLETCINECESVTEPFGPIHTLLGQALLESGRPSDAIDALKAANAISPADPLPLVQLIKAYLVTGIQTEAMKCVDKCRKILGHHIEIECLAAMTILSGPCRNAEFTSRTYRSLGKHMVECPDDIEAYSLAMELACELNDKEQAQKFTRQLELSATTNQQRLALKVSEILKKAGELMWHDISRELIDKTISVTRNGYGQLTQ